MMKEEYDFSNGERGKFYHKDATFNLPIYLVGNFHIILSNNQDGFSKKSRLCLQ